jgi:hypothetical protein
LEIPVTRILQLNSCLFLLAHGAGARSLDGRRVASSEVRS